MKTPLVSPLTEEHSARLLDLNTKLRAEIIDRADQIDPSDELDWDDLILGWAIAQGLGVDQEHCSVKEPYRCAYCFLRQAVWW